MWMLASRFIVQFALLTGREVARLDPSFGKNRLTQDDNS
jgi:hypothetical protein